MQRLFFILTILFSFLASAEITFSIDEDVAEINNNSDQNWRIKTNRRRYEKFLTPEQMKYPFIQNLLLNSGRQFLLPDPRALLDMLCFKDKYSNTVFQPKKAGESNQARCNQFKDVVDGQGSRNSFTMGEKCKALFVDYSVDQTVPRGWLVDLCSAQIIRGPFAAAQGRGDGAQDNLVPTPTSNAFDKPINYVSNTPDTNTSAGGFFVATQKYDSTNVGPAMNMQGVEGGINDNACDRRTVVHSVDYVFDNRTTGLSKGCISLSTETNEEVRNNIAGKGKDKPGAYSGGGMIYVVTNAEKAIVGNNCGRNVLIYAPIPQQRPSKKTK